MVGAKRIFLTAEWRDLVMLNYQVNPDFLHQYVPAGTELDSFAGKTYLSLVGFRFLRSKFCGKIPLPFHTDFEEVNLRFYVRRPNRSEERRGVCFVREIVPKRLIAWTARLWYRENYQQCRMAHRIEQSADGGKAEYTWQVGRQRCRLSAAAGKMTYPLEGSLEQFITEHYWGYSKQKGGGSLEYRVTHVPWRVAEATNAGFEGDARANYGERFAAILGRRPDSAFLADGSSVEVFFADRIA
jgi:uncharacterized protein